VRPGFTPLNWNSLHVTQYLSDVTKSLQQFDSVLGQVRKSCSMLEDAVACIGDTVLVSVEEFDARGACLEVVEVFDIREVIVPRFFVADVTEPLEAGSLGTELHRREHDARNAREL
jgi:hypothetical protein